MSINSSPHMFTRQNFPARRFQRLLRGIFEMKERQVENFHRLVHLRGDEPVDERSSGIRITLPMTVNGVPHLNLTRPMHIRETSLKRTIKRLQIRLQSARLVWSIPYVPVTALIVLRFSASFTSFMVLEIDAKTRSFLALEIGARYNLVSRIDPGLSTPDGDRVGGRSK